MKGHTKLGRNPVDSENSYNTLHSLTGNIHANFIPSLFDIIGDGGIIHIFRISSGKTSEKGNIRSSEWKFTTGDDCVPNLPKDVICIATNSNRCKIEGSFGNPGVDVHSSFVVVPCVEILIVGWLRIFTKGGVIVSCSWVGHVLVYREVSNCFIEIKF